MNISQQDYQSLVNKASPKSTLAKDCLCAFLSGGLICVLGQALTDTFQFAAGQSLDNARCLTSISLIFAAALFTVFGWYGKLAKVSGAGTLVPITGFSNAIVSPAMEFRSEGLIMGVGAKMFLIAGPVIVYGTLASILYGFLLCLG